MSSAVTTQVTDLQNYINGAWSRPSSSDFFDVTNPATTELLARTPMSSPADVDAAVQAREERERLGARQRRPQERLACDVGDTPVRGLRITPCVDAEQLGPSGRRPVEAEQQSDRRRLAGAVRAEIAVHLALVDRQVETVEGHRLAVALRQARGMDCGHRLETTL